MKIAPVAISLIASQISSNFILLLPTEMYYFGTQIMVMALSVFLATFVIAYVTLPVLYHSGLTNAYEYLELRFDWRVRRLITLIFLLLTLGMAPIVSFVAALALSSMTGINVHIVNGVICLFCASYTMLGGIKAVIWTDVVQAAVMVGSILVIVILAIIGVGGVRNVFEISNAGGRLELFNMSPSLTIRNSFWNTFLNQLVQWLGYAGLNQISVQRLVAVPSLSHARRVAFITCFGVTLMLVLTCVTGLTMYATFYNCDPVKAGILAKPDLMVPYLAMQTIGHLPGMPGLFIATILSAALSTLSAQFNTLSGVIYQDVIRKIWVGDRNHKTNLCMKLIVLATGIYCALSGFVIAMFTHIFPIFLIVVSIPLGATTGVFTLGMLTPWANKTGALFGAAASIILMTWIAIGNRIALINGSLVYQPLPTSTQDCENFNINISTLVFPNGNRTILSSSADSPFILYTLSFNYFAVAGVLIVWVVGLTVSFATGAFDSRTVDKSLFAPCIHWMLPNKKTVIKPEVSETQFEEEKFL